MLRTRKTPVAALGAAALLAFVGEARAQQQPSSGTIAEVLFREGQQLLAAGRTSEACVKFRASQTAEPALGTLLNLAVCHEREGRAATAWLEYAEVASLAHQAGDGAREKYAQTRLANIEPNLHKVALEAAEPIEGFVLFLDETEVPPSTFGVGIPVDPGEHELRAKAPGKAPWSWKFTTTAEPGTERITVPALKSAAPAAGPPPGPVAPSPKPVASLAPAASVTPVSAPAGAPSSKLDLRLVAYGSAGLAVVGLGTSLYFGVSASNHASQRDELCPPGVACYDQRAFHEHHSAEVAQTWMLVTGGVGLAAAGAAAALFVVTSTTSSGAASFRAAPWVGSGTVGATAEGRF
jgi:hypothetical protein